MSVFVEESNELYEDLEQTIFKIFDNIVWVYDWCKATLNPFFKLLKSFYVYLFCIFTGPLLYLFLQLMNKWAYFSIHLKKATKIFKNNIPIKYKVVILSAYNNTCIYWNYVLGIYYAVQGRNVEPIYSEWINVSLLGYNSGKSEYFYKEEYLQIKSIDDCGITPFIENIQVEPIFISSLIIIKTDNLYTYRVNSYNILIENGNNLSDVRFLSVEYSHPKMINPLYINLSKNHFLIGNQILSFVFVLRYLKYNFAQNDYVFDDDYIINIMDDNINMFDLNSTQYVELKESMYKIIDV
jgi:hypothetical protein